MGRSRTTVCKRAGVAPNGSCFCSEYAALGTAAPQKRATLCAAAGAKYLKVGSTVIDLRSKSAGPSTGLSNKENTKMREYEGMELPPLADIEDMDGFFGDFMGFLKDAAIGGVSGFGAIVGYNILGKMVAEKVPVVGTYLAPAIPFLGAFAAEKWITPKHHNIGQALKYTSVAVGFFGVFKALGMFDKLGVSSLMGLEGSVDTYLPEYVGGQALLGLDSLGFRKHSPVYLGEPPMGGNFPESALLGVIDEADELDGLGATTVMSPEEAQDEDYPDAMNAEGIDTGMTLLV